MTSARTMVCPGFVALALTLSATGILAQDLAKADTQVFPWPEEKWPFPIDQWGTGQAFDCAAERCGREVHLYLRAKIGFAGARPVFPMTMKSSGSATSN